VFWDPASERFELELRHGRVAVRGPVLGEDLVLRSGQRLSVSLPKAETVITEVRADRAVDAAPGASAPPAPLDSVSAAATPSAAPRSPNEVPAQGSPPALAAANERRWKEALAKGQWDRILADAERDGVGAILETAPSADLFALADAARYRRRTDLARSALFAQRRRFPDSPRSLDAIFLLGRVEEARANASAQAIKWYEAYLAAAPAGTYAAEALGRKMILANEVQGAASARQIADEYLRRFPQGSHAAAARAFQRVP
jgi:TolA-binding protein